MKEIGSQYTRSVSHSGAAFLGLLALLTALAFGEPVEIPGAEPGQAAQPQVAAGHEGRIHVVFGERKNGAILFSSSENGGKRLAKAIEIGRIPELALGMGRGPRIATSGHSVAVTAISHADGMIHGWHSGDDGQTWKQTAPLNSAPASAKEGLHSMAANEKGIVAAVWLDGRSGGTEILAAVSKNGGATWEPDVRVYKSPSGTVCECCRPSVAVGRDGRIAVMWRNWLEGSRDMWIAQSGDGGKTYDAGRKLGKGTWKLKGCPMDGGGLVFGDDGGIKTVWRREGTVFQGGFDGDEQELEERAIRPGILANGNSEIRFYEKGGNLVFHPGPGKNSEVLARGSAFPSGAVLSNGQPVFVWEHREEKSAILMLEVFGKE